MTERKSVSDSRRSAPENARDEAERLKRAMPSWLYWLAVCVAILGGVAVVVALVRIPSFAQKQFAMTPRAADWLIAHVVIGFAVGAWTGSFLAKRFRPQVVVACSLVVFVVSIFATLVTLHSKTAFKFTLVLLGLGLGMLIFACAGSRAKTGR